MHTSVKAGLTAGTLKEGVDRETDAAENHGATEQHLWHSRGGGGGSSGGSGSGDNSCSYHVGG